MNSILDLNEDCWRLILEHVPVRDIIRSERTSRQWQQMVLRYLIGCHISVTDGNVIKSDWYNNWNDGHKTSEACHLELSIKKYDSFISWTNKLGSSVVAAYCHDTDSMLVLTENCPNLQSLVSDACVSELIGDTALIQLEANSYQLTGGFLNAINTSNLKLLAFDDCPYFESQYLLPITGLTRLKLTDVTAEISDVEAVLANNPDLEWLEIQSVWADMRRHHSKALYKLTRLKYLNVNFRMGDGEVDSITRSCKELKVFALTDCEGLLSSEGIEAICRNAGTRLIMLHLEYVINDDDLITIIRCCPKLEVLKVAAVGLSPAVTLRAAAARAAVCGAGAGGAGGAGAAGRARRPLRLELKTYLPVNDPEPDGDENLERIIEQEYEDLSVTWHYCKD